MHKSNRLFVTFIISIFILAGCVYSSENQELEPNEIVFDTEKIEDKLQIQNEENVEPEATEEPIAGTEATEVTSEDATIVEDDFVKVELYIPDIWVELRYAGTDNFTGQKIYDFSDAYLRYGTVQKLMEVQAVLREQGLSLKIWDAFRPTSAQFTLWEVYPDAVYVANPNNGFSSHSRGNTIDITLVNEKGEELLMPTGFDDFSKLADRDYSDCSEEAKENVMLLERIMKEHGFKAYSGEWWHFTDVDDYPVEKEFRP